MRYVSPYYAPFADVRKTEMQIAIKAIDSNADPNAQFTTTAAAVDDTTHFLDDVATETNFPELEQGLWILDGNGFARMIGANVGWWSEELSDEDAVFSTPPTITVYFGGVAISTPGTSIDFDPAADSYAAKIRLTTYDADGRTVINTAEFENYTPYAVMRMESNNYYYLKIEFLESKMPLQRVRVSEIVFGLKLRYDGGSMEKMTLALEADITAEKFPSGQLDIVIDNSERLFDILAPNNIFAYLQTGKIPLSISASINGESLTLGQYYFTSAKSSNGGLTATIRANDKALMLDRAEFLPQDTDTQLWVAVNAVLKDTGITNFKFMDSVRLNNVYMGVPEGTSKREALRLFAQAARCSLWFDRDGALRFGTLPVGAQMQHINDDCLYDFNGVSLKENVDVIELIARDTENENGDTIHNIFRSGEGEAVKTIRNPCVALGEGQAVADWLLECYKRRRRYQVSNQGDPALDIGDTVRIADTYGQNLLAVMTGVTLKYDGILSAVTKAVGEVAE